MDEVIAERAIYKVRTCQPDQWVERDCQPLRITTTYSRITKELSRIIINYYLEITKESLLNCQGFGRPGWVGTLLRKAGQRMLASVQLLGLPTTS